MNLSEAWLVCLRFADLENSNNRNMHSYLQSYLQKHGLTSNSKYQFQAIQTSSKYQFQPVPRSNSKHQQKPTDFEATATMSKFKPLSNSTLLCNVFIVFNNHFNRLYTSLSLTIVDGNCAKYFSSGHNRSTERGRRFNYERPGSGCDGDGQGRQRELS